MCVFYSYFNGMALDGRIWLSILLHVPRVSHASVSGLRGSLVGAGLQGDVPVAALTDLLLAEVAPAKKYRKFKNSSKKV